MSEKGSLVTLHSESKVVISRVLTEDLPDVAESELLAFMHQDEYTLFHPNIKALRDSDTPVRQWPDFNDLVEVYQRSLVSRSLLFKAVREEDNKFMGFASIHYPGGRQDRTWLDWLWGDCLYPAMKWLGLSEKYPSFNMEAMGLYISACVAYREKLMQGREYATLSAIFVRPDSQSKGVGSILLDHCMKLIEPRNVPTLLESSQVAVEFYENNGFQQTGEVKIEYKGKAYSWPSMLREAPQCT